MGSLSRTEESRVWFLNLGQRHVEMSRMLYVLAVAQKGIKAVLGKSNQSKEVRRYTGN